MISPALLAQDDSPATASARPPGAHPARSTYAERTRRGWPVLATALTGLLLAVAAPIGIIVGVDGPARTEGFQAAVALQTVVLAHTGIGLTIVLWSTHRRPMQLAFWVFSYVWLGLAPLAMLANDDYPLSLRVDASVSFRASLLVEAGLVAYMVGAMVLGRPSSPRMSSVQARLRQPLNPRRVLLYCLATLALAVLLLPRLGGVGSFLVSRQESAEATLSAAGGSGTAGKSLFTWTLSVTAFWALLGLLFCRPFTGPRAAYVLPRLLMLIPIGLLNVVVNNPLSRPRFWFGTVVLGLLFIWLAGKRMRLWRVASWGVLAMVVVLFPFADYFRYEEPQLPEGGISAQFTNNGDYDAYQQIQGGVALVDEGGYQPTLSLGAPLFWVPRALWPEKPEAAGPVIGEFIGYSFVNLSSPLWIEAYMWGGLLVVLVVFFALGAGSARLDGWFDRNRHRRDTALTLLVPALAFFQIILLRGSLLAVIAPLLPMLVIPFLLTEPRTRRSSPPAPTRRPSPADGPTLVTGSTTVRN